jgi:hypothetical protein
LNEVFAFLAVSARNVDGTIYVTIDEGGRCRVSELKIRGCNYST